MFKIKDPRKYRLQKSVFIKKKPRLLRPEADALAASEMLVLPGWRSQLDAFRTFDWKNLTPWLQL